jgi:hypothetical protein
MIVARDPFRPEQTHRPNLSRLQYCGDPMLAVRLDNPRRLLIARRSISAAIRRNDWPVPRNQWNIDG